MSEKIDYWPQILEALRQDECILLIGPKAASFENTSLHSQLIQHLETKLLAMECLEKRDNLNLPALIKKFKDFYSTTIEALEQLGATLKNFYESIDPEKIPEFQKIAELDFKYIINTTPDDLLVQALEASEKTCHFFDFHFQNSIYNAEKNEEALDLDKEISISRPLVYNFLGHYHLPNSLVLTELDQINFLEIILQKEFTTSKFTNILYHFIKKPKKTMRKTYLFLGFDFNDWPMKMFLHVLGKEQDLPPLPLAPDAELLKEESKIFFEENFNLVFVENNSLAFLNELQTKRHAEKPKQPASGPINLMLLYDLEDEAFGAEMETHLKAVNRRNGGVNIFHRGKVEPDQEIDATMKMFAEKTDIFIPLLTKNFVANQDLFSELFNIANKKYKAKEAKITILIMTPCLHDSFTPFDDKIEAIYPAPPGWAFSQEIDRDASILDFVKELERIIRGIIATRNRPK